MRRKIYFDNTTVSLVLLLVLVRDVSSLLAVMGAWLDDAGWWVMSDAVADGTTLPLSYIVLLSPRRPSPPICCRC